MATAEDAKLILKLYEMRREELMRKARGFLMSPEFMPTSADEIKTIVMGDPQKGAMYRQATSYWDMAAALVNHGTIDAALFFETNGEHIGIWAKIGDFIPELRNLFGPQYMQNLEKLVNAHPNGAARVQLMKERFKQMAEARAAKSS